MLTLLPSQAHNLHPSKKENKNQEKSQITLAGKTSAINDLRPIFFFFLLFLLYSWLF